MLADIDFRQLMGAFRYRFNVWHPREVIVEDKVSGTSLLQTFKGSHIPLRGQKVPDGKIERAVGAVGGSGRRQGVGGGAASVQGWMRMHRVLYPAGEKWVPDWQRALLSVAGGTKVPDEFDATVHLITRAIARSRKVGMLPSSAGAGADAAADAAASGPSPADPRLLMLQGLAGMAQVSEQQAQAMEMSPFRGLCMGGCWAFQLAAGNGGHWCARHDRSTTALDGCTDWAVRSPPASAPGREAFFHG